MLRYYFYLPEEYDDNDLEPKWTIEAPNYSEASQKLSEETSLHSFCQIEKIEKNLRDDLIERDLWMMVFHKDYGWLDR